MYIYTHVIYYSYSRIILIYSSILAFVSNLERLELIVAEYVGIIRYMIYNI